MSHLLGIEITAGRKFELSIYEIVQGIQ